MASGIEVGDECAHIFHKDFKLDKKFKWIMYRIADDDKSVIIDRTEDEPLNAKERAAITPEEAKGRFDAFCEELLKEPIAKYCIVDIKCWLDEPNGTKRAVTKIALLSWCPDTLTPRKKMMFASTKDAMKKKLVDGFKEVQCSSADDLDYEEVSQKLLKV